MKEIKLKKLKLVYFKKFKDLEIDFNDNTVISGRNREGKSTIFDAFMWLLFGKDSLGNSDFDIKTLDENENVIERVDHEVCAELEINGAITTLKRVLRENWVKPHGQDAQILKGNDTKCFFDGVPVSVGDYQKRVNEIVDENLFILITNTNYFHSLKREDRRNILVSLAGDITNESILEVNPDYSDIVELLKNYTSEDLKKKIGAEKKRIKDELEHIPIRIDEIKKNMPETVDFNAISKEIEVKKSELSKIDKQISDKQESVKAEIEKANEKQKQIGELKLKQSDILIEAELEATKTASDKNKDFYNYQSVLEEKEEKVSKAEKKITEKKKEIEYLNERLSQANAEREKLVVDWKTENAKTFQHKAAITCPNCSHEFHLDEEAETEFVEWKKKQLQRINELGKKAKERIEGFEHDLECANGELLSLKSQHESIFKDYQAFTKFTPTKVEAEKVVQENIREWADLEAEISAIKVEEVVQDNSGLNAERTAINDEIVKLSLELNKKSLIENSFKRIDELTKEQRMFSQALSEQEKIEFRLIQFNKLKMEEVDKRVNGKFKMVTFKLFDKTLDGNEFETCETLINGVRYFSANNEARINGGIDIINAICEHNEIFAPVFIDNSEGVNEFIETKSQLIQLKVTDGSFKVG